MFTLLPHVKEDETLEALTAADEEEEFAAAALEEQEQLSSGEEPEQGPAAQGLEQAEVVSEPQVLPCPQAEAASVPTGAVTVRAVEGGLEQYPQEGVFPHPRLHVCCLALHSQRSQCLGNGE